MCRASDSGHGGARPVLAVLGPGIAPPSNRCNLFVDVSLRFCRGVASDHVEVGWERDLGFVDVLVVCFEGGWVHFSVVVAVYVV